MIRKTIHFGRLALTLLLTLFSSLAWSQKELTVYEGTDMSNYIPTYVYYYEDYTRSQFVIPSDDLYKMMGGDISGLKFYTNDRNIPFTTNCEVDVYLKEVDYTTIKSYEEKHDCTMVYQGTLQFVLTDNGGEVFIEFNSPFTYNNGNLLIGFENTNKGAYKSINFYGKYVTGAAVSGHSNSDLALVSAYSQNFIPKTTFSYFLFNLNTPRDLTVTNITCNNVDIDWTDTNYEGTTWEIAYSDVSGFNPNKEGTKITTSTKPYTLTDLNEETTYEFYVRAINGEDDSDWSSVQVFTTALKRDTPLDLSVTDVQAESAVLSWTAGEEEQTAWDIAYKSVTDDDFTIIENVTVTAYTLSGLTSGTTYTVKVRGNYGEGEYSDWTAPVDFTTSTPLLTPSDLTAGNISTNSAEITWTGISEADSYVLRYQECNGNPTTATIILTTDDVWGDGSGYQMLLDPTASAYGSIIPETGALNSGGDVDNSVYDEFAYKIPEDADGSLTTTHMVLDSSVSITVPAGTYDWCITNPTPNDRMWIASENGTVGGRADDFVFEAGKIYEFHVYLGTNNDATDVTVTYDLSVLIDPDAWIVINDVTSPTELTGLNPDSQYAVQVQAVCDGSTSEWSDFIAFHTLAFDAVPTDLLAENVTHRSAELSWFGVQDTYDVRWRTEGTPGNVFSEDWNSDIAGWTAINLDSQSGIGDGYGVDDSRCMIFHYTTNPPQYIISPELERIRDGHKLSFYYCNYSSYYPESFKVGYSTTTKDIEAFTWSDEVTVGSDTDWHIYEGLDLPKGTKYICIQCTSYDQYYLCVDNITISGPEIAAGEWQYANDVTFPFVVDNLEMTTDYEWQVMGKNPDTDWSESAFFTTGGEDYKIFFADGDWSDDENWTPAGAPTVDDHVIVRADAIIPSGYIATSGAIYVEGGSITIKDGGELKTGSHGVPVTLEKEIPAGQYRLIASPFYSLILPSSIEGIMTSDSDYDLYAFDAAEDDEWRNFKGHEADNPTMDPCFGYLYANEEGTTLKFTGKILASINNPHHLLMSFNEGTDFYNGWMLVGNPYACTAYIYYIDENNDFQDCYFYKQNDTGTFEIYSKAVKLAPGEAAFIKVDFSDYIYFSTEDLGLEPVLKGDIDYPVMPAIMWTEDDQDAAPTFYLADGDENTDMIDFAEEYSGINVGIDGRTIYTNGIWNTICLPFELTLEGSPLEGATVLPFEDATVEDNVLYLDFGDPVTTLAAGTPYIIKWSPALSQNIENPIFRFDEVPDVKETPQSVEVDGVISFIGTYAPVTFDDENRSVLIMGSNNNLFYPDGLETSYVNAFRGYFLLNENYTTGVSGNEIKSIAFNLDEGEPTSIFNVTNERQEDRNGVFDLSGRRVSKPGKGIYIKNGQKVLMK